MGKKAKTMNKVDVLAVCVEMLEEHNRLHKMRKMYEESGEDDRAQYYLSQAIGVEAAAKMLRTAAGLDLFDDVTPAFMERH